MKIGNFEVPEFRLVPNCVSDIKKIYDATKFDKITSKDLAKLLGYKASTSGRFYIRLKSLISYGLLQAGNTVTNLGYQIAYPESPEQEDLARKKAIFNVGLWKELYKQVENNPPVEFWLPLSKAAKIDAPTAQKHQQLIKKWYIEDIGLLPLTVLTGSGYLEEAESEPLRSTKTQTPSMQQQIIQSSDVEIIPFANRYAVTMPKGDLKKEWKMLQKYMELYLEDYKPKKSSNIEDESEIISEDYIE